MVGVVAKPPFPLSPAKTGRDIGDEDRASAMFVDAGDRCRPTIAPPPAVGGAQATLRCGLKCAPPVPSCGTERESAAASARRASSSAERAAMVYRDPSGPVGAVSGGRKPPRQNRPKPPLQTVFLYIGEAQVILIFF